MNIERSATISDCLRYRYRLSRWWRDGPRVAWLMMNPSTADALVDDATIRKCIGFAQRWGFDGIEVINLFALRDRNPSGLLTASDAVGPQHWDHFEEAVAWCPIVIAAWGCESTLKKSYHLRVQSLALPKRLANEWPEIKIQCLGKSKHGTPYHPLMLPYSTERQDFTVTQ